MNLIKWHKQIIHHWQNKTGISDYQMLWHAGFSGFVLGAILVFFVL
tara:strand:+ start:2257 stop:2394 length:138 start_codon:yes stop_codon:yes gene_type:complete